MKTQKTWWRHQMETFYALLALCAGNSQVTGEFLSQRPVTHSFDIFFDLRLNKRLRKQSRGWWFETPSRSLWRNCNERKSFAHFLGPLSMQHQWYLSVSSRIHNSTILGWWLPAGLASSFSGEHHKNLCITLRISVSNAGRLIQVVCLCFIDLFLFVFVRFGGNKIYCSYYKIWNFIQALGSL